MNLRHFRQLVFSHWVRRGARVCAALLVVLGTSGCAAPVDDVQQEFDVTERSIGELNEALETGAVTSQDLVQLYLDRVNAFDQEGPALNAVIALNPDAIDEAAMLDAERATGSVRGPLHGIPVLVKDNYDTANMTTTAGAIGLATSIPPDDAFQVRRLKDAGAVILGKTNMHELARGITTISSLAGQTRNPYDPTRNPGGSSGGTGAAVAASFAAVGMGSDTCGSIRIPSSHHALVGLRGTRGLASGDGIIPLSTTQDIGGPLARSVEDLAITLDATVGFDPADPTTELSQGNVPDTYTAFLDENGMAAARIGVVTALMGSGGAEQPVRDVVEVAIEAMKELGADVVDIEEPDLTELLTDASVIGLEFKFDFDAYLAETPDAPVRSLDQLIELGLLHEVVEGGVLDSAEVESLDTDEYRERLARRDTVRAATLALMDEHDLDALLYPTIRETARTIGQGQGGSNCALSAVSGLPAISVPAGFAANAMPVGVELLGGPFSESRLISLAYAFEQATNHRRPPDFTPSLRHLPPPVQLVSTVTPGSGDISGQAEFVLDPTTWRLRYSLSVDPLGEADVLLVDFHGKTEGVENGPSIRRLGAGRAIMAGEITLEGHEIHRLRTGGLYIDVHTREELPGAIRFDLTLPQED